MVHSEGSFDSLEDFMTSVKDGSARGTYYQEKLEDSVVVELSVSHFKDGYVFLRVFVEEAGIDFEEEMYFRRLYAVSEKYERVHAEVRERIEAENETKVRNAHEWTAEPARFVEQYPFFPETLSHSNTGVFSDNIMLRDDVSLGETAETNRGP